MPSLYVAFLFNFLYPVCILITHPSVRSRRHSVSKFCLEEQSRDTSNASFLHERAQSLKKKNGLTKRASYPPSPANVDEAQLCWTWQIASYISQTSVSKCFDSSPAHSRQLVFTFRTNSAVIGGKHSAQHLVNNYIEAGNTFMAIFSNFVYVTFHTLTIDCYSYTARTNYPQGHFSKVKGSADNP